MHKSRDWLIAYMRIWFQSGGEEVTKFLQYICSNDIDKSVGTIVHTGMLNDKGGFENDCSVIRLAHNKSEPLLQCLIS